MPFPAVPYRHHAPPGTASYLTVPAFEELTQGAARVAVSTRHGGVSTGPYSTLNLGLSSGDDPGHVEENRRRLCSALEVDPAATVGMTQVHGARVAFVDAGAGGASLPATDGLATTVPGLALRALAADCVPVALCDPRRGAVATIHAGWRGILAGVVPAAVALLAEHAGTRPTTLIAAVGPCIGPCHYAVGPDVADPFAAAFAGHAAGGPVVLERREGTYLDLPAAVDAQLRACGVAAETIVHMGLCTACRTDLFYSHRAEGRTGRFGLLAWVAA